MIWCMQRTNIYLEDQQTQSLDRLAAEQGISRAELIRRLIDRGLAGEADREADLARIDFAFGGADIEMPARTRSARSRRLDALRDADA